MNDAAVPTDRAVKSLKESTLRGGVARLFAQGANFVVRLVSLMVLARLLTPQDFGLVGMVTAFTGVLNLFRDFGLSTATVQRAEVTKDQISTLFWINVAVGLVLGIVVVCLAPIIANFYHEPRLLWVAVVLASGFFFNAAGVQHSAVLQRDMRFTALAVINIASLLTSAALAIGMAKMGYGYWSLVLMTVCAPLVITAGVWATAGWMPGLPRLRVGLRSIVRFGSTVTLNGIVVYVAYNFEKILLGRFWGANVIGIYGRAYQLANIPTENLNVAVGEVAFSALSRVQHDPDRLKKYFLTGYSLVLTLTVPITIMCAVFSKDAIAVFLGSKWAEAAPVFQLLAPTILSFAMINPFAWLLFATGRVERSLKIALVIAPLVISGYLIGLPYGLKGVAIGYSSAMVLWIVPNILWCVQGTSISFWDVVHRLRLPLVSGIVAALPALALQLFVDHNWPPLPRLIVEVGVFIAVYVFMLFYVMGEKDFYLSLIRGLHPGHQPMNNALETA